MLLVPFDLEIVDSNAKSRSVPLSLEPEESLLKDCTSTVCGSLAAWSGTQGVHDDVMLGGTDSLRHASTNHGVGTKGKAQPVSGSEHRSERLRFVDIEQAVPVHRFASREDQERTSSHLPPQEVAPTVRRVGEQRPHEVVSRLLRSVASSVTKKKR